VQSTPEVTLDRLDHRSAASPDAAPADEAVAPVPWTTLRTAWQADLAPWADRVVCVWLPLTRAGHVPWWPRLTPSGTLILAIQPQGWRATDRRRWLRIWHRWALSRRGDPTDRGLAPLNTVHEAFPWVRAFPVTQDARPETGWHWHPRTVYPVIAPGTDATDGTALAQAAAQVLTHCPSDYPPVILADRWQQSPWRTAPQPRTLAAVGVCVFAGLGVLFGFHGTWLVAWGWLGGTATLWTWSRAWSHWWTTYAWDPR